MRKLICLRWAIMRYLVSRWAIMRYLVSRCGLYHLLPASVAQLDARPTGDQEVAGSTPTGLATFLRGDLS